MMPPHKPRTEKEKLITSLQQSIDHLKRHNRPTEDLEQELTKAKQMPDEAE